MFTLSRLDQAGLHNIIVIPVFIFYVKISDEGEETMQKNKYFILVPVMIVSLLLCSCASGGSPAGANKPDQTYSITKVSGDFDWSTIPVIPIDKVLWTEDYGIRAEGQLCYDEDQLFVHLRAVEKEIRAVNTEPLSPVYEDSCLEFFFMPEGSPNYFNFEINPNGCLGAGYGPEKTDRISIVREDAADYFDILTNRTADGWEVFYRIPLKYIRLFDQDFAFKGSMSGNMYKCGNKTVNKHYLSWTEIELDTPNFHCPEYFGKLIFE